MYRSQNNSRKDLIAILAFFLLCLYIPLNAQIPKTKDVWELSLEELQQIKITTASKFPQKTTDAPSVITVISQREIKNMGARNIEEALRGIVGIDIIAKEFQPLPYIGIRGMFSTGSNNKTKIMINGHTMQSVVGDMFFHLNKLPLDNIKQIEIIRGPGSALYGDNAFTGVINIITNEESDSHNLTLRGGSFNTIFPSINMGFKKEKFKFHVYADYCKTDGPSSLIESDFATKAFGSQYSAAPGYTTEGSNHCTFQTNMSYGNFSFNGFYQNLTSEVPIGIALALTDENEIKSEIIYGELEFKLPLTKGNLNIKAFCDYHNYNALYEILSEETTVFYSNLYPATPYPSNEGLNIEILSKLSVVGSNLDFDYELHKDIKLLFGAGYKFLNLYDISSIGNGNSSGRPLAFDGITYQPNQYYGFMRDISDSANWIQPSKRQMGALYGQGIFDLKELFNLADFCNSLDLTLGARYDSYDDIGSSFNPRAGLVFGLSNQLSFKLLYGSAFRAPFFHETVQSSSVSSGQKDLKSEHISTFELSTTYLFSDKIIGNISVFRIRASELILRNSSGIYSNFGKYQSDGIEAELKFYSKEANYGFLNFTYQDVRDTTHQIITNAGGLEYEQLDLYSGRAPSFMGNIGANYKVSKFINANIALNYVGERSRSNEKKFDASGALVLVDERNPVPARTLLSASFIFRNFSTRFPGLELQITGYNLLNADHIDPEPAGKVLNDIPRAKRHFMARISYYF
ncbi:MAG: TonB-dependent receptor [Chrysiogenia bacterium]